MDESALLRRAEIARRLKAARWIAGTHVPHDKGKMGYRVEALTPEKLAERSPLPENGITATLLGAIERMERHTPPMELAAIASALNVDPAWFDVERDPGPDALSAWAEQLVRELVPVVLAHRQEPAEGAGTPDVSDHPQGHAEVGGA